MIFSALKRVSSNNEFDALNGEARRISALLGKVREYDVVQDLINSVPNDHINNDPCIDELIYQIKDKKEYSLEHSKIIISEGMAAIFIIKVERFLNKSGYLKLVYEGDSDNQLAGIDKISSLVLTVISISVF